jgi:gliding motility-associated-like protein
LTELDANTSELIIENTIENNSSVSVQKKDVEVINEIDLIEKPISETIISIENKQTDLVVEKESKNKKSVNKVETALEEKTENEQAPYEELVIENTETTLTAIIGEVPNVFTPNNDGVNDYFMFETENVEAFTVIITDQLDRTVFESNNPKFEWDGRDLGGNLVPNAVYNYFVIAIGADKKMVKTAGQVYVR